MQQPTQPTQLTQLTQTIGRLTVHLMAQRVGSDLNIIVYGGDRPHIGAVALANAGSDENTCLGVCLPGHRESELAKFLAVSLANHINASVCVSCGIHLDNITRDEIDAVDSIIRQFVGRLEQFRA